MSLLTRDLTCQQAVELVTDYLEGNLSRHNRRRFEKHLRGCPNCPAYLEQIRMTIRFTGRVEVGELDTQTQDDLTELYRRYRSDQNDST